MIPSDAKLVKTIEDFEDFCDMAGVTVMVTCRVRVRPRWCVRLMRQTTQRVRFGHWVQAVSDDLNEALEDAYLAWLEDGEAKNPGHYNHDGE